MYICIKQDDDKRPERKREMCRSVCDVSFDSFTIQSKRKFATMLNMSERYAICVHFTLTRNLTADNDGLAQIFK